MLASLKNVIKRYGDQTVVDHLNLDVIEGEVLGLLGPNGAGKTTAINIHRSNIRLNQKTIS